MNVKTICQYLPILLVAFLVGCNKDVSVHCQELGVESIALELPEEPVKLCLAPNLMTVLENDDMFSVFYKSSVNELWYYQGDGGRSAGVLQHKKGIRKESGPRIVAVYPYYESSTMSGNLVNTVLADVQYYREGSYGSSVMTAVSTEKNLNFKYSCGFVSLKLYGEAEVKTLSMSGNNGEKLAGKCTVDVSSDGPTIISASSLSVQMRNRDFSKICFKDSCEFLFGVAPGTFENGYSFKVIYSNGTEQNIAINKPVTVVAGQISASAAAVVNSIFCLEANFRTDGSETVNPFSQDINRSILPASGGESGDIFLSSDKARNYPFRFCVSDVSLADNLRITSGAGLTFGGTVGDYILLPAVSGKYLSCVRAVLSKGGALSLDGQGAVSILKYGVVELKGLESSMGKSVRLSLTTDKIVSISNLRLYYE